MNEYSNTMVHDFRKFKALFHKRGSYLNSSLVKSLYTCSVKKMPLTIQCNLGRVGYEITIR